ncbi:hypothetical protein [Aeromonas veronii]|uniref:hypothetical protein n=1 Tax=Aeromonas veronii TaxID=654 RepID=UPI003D1DA3A2
MARFEVVHPLEGMWDPLQVRIDLRQMFERWLSRSQYSQTITEQNEIIDELSLLELCQHYRLEYLGGVEDVAKNWDESTQRIADNGPTFDELTRLGWLFFDGCRWCMQSVPLGTSSYITYPTPSTEAFLTNLDKLRLVAKSDTPSPVAKKLAAKILNESWLEHHIPTRNPDWLAGRLWEQLCPNHPLNVYSVASVENEMSDSSVLPEMESIDRAFLEWSAWCSVLQTQGSWDINWGPTEMRSCREAAQRVLERQTLWGTWDNDVPRYIDILEKTFAIPQEQLRYFRIPRPEPQKTLVSRADWLKGPNIEYFMMRGFCARTVNFAFNFLCSELEKTDIGSNLKRVADTVISFATSHPMALQQLLLRVETCPALLVDMLMHQHAACLATKLVIEWQPRLRRNNDRAVSREAKLKEFAIQDSLSFLVYQLHEETLDIEEYASLITWCYTSTNSARAVADSRKPCGQQLLWMVSKEREALQSMLMQLLISQMAYENNIPRARFTSVLEGVNCLLNAQVKDTRSIVTLYSKFAKEMNLDWTDAPSLSAELAARLVAIALTQKDSDRDALLIPFDSKKLLREISDDQRLTLKSAIARTMREHVRLLARAVVGWADEVVPKELCDALQTLISRCVIEHEEKGRVGALTDRYSPSSFLGREDGSPAQDLAAAWRRLENHNQEAMLQSLAQSDDPVLLAELSLHLPTPAKPFIQKRLRQLKPGEASTTWTWPEVQHRIETLLAAGEYELACEHLDDAKPYLANAPQEFQISLFGLELQLFLKEKNWAALDSTAVPSGVNEFTRRKTQEHLDFYRATSQLIRPNGDLVSARAQLERLASSPSAAFAYKENVFAVSIQQLLGPHIHPLTGMDKVTGETLLAEINAMVALSEQQASSSLLANRALLLLALQRPEDALESVAVRRREEPSPNLELVTVLATIEMGFKEEAMAILDAAITEFGANDQLIGVKKDLEAGTPSTSITSPSVSIDPISSIRSALQQLSELPPSQLGDVLGPPGRGVRGYLVRQVSRAVSSLQHMAAMLRDRKNPEDEARLEDDLNTVVREMLGASLAVAKWDVADQSLGGATKNGNPGERDAVIRSSGQEISIYEALVCSTLDRSNTKIHFHKLLSYGICDIYFHVTYSYAKEVKPLLDYVRKMLEHDAPPELTYIDCETLQPPDSELSGYMATYRVDHREIAVVFLIVDLKV